MPQPYDYTVAQPDVGTYFQAMKAGRDDRAVQQASQDAGALKRYFPAAAGGDKEALGQVMGLNPEIGMKLTAHLNSMDEASRNREIAISEWLGPLLMDQTGRPISDPQQIMNVQQMAAQRGLPPDRVQAITPQNIPLLVQGSEAARNYKRQIAQDALSARETNASIAAKNAAADASRRSGQGGGSGPGNAAMQRAALAQQFGIDPNSDAGKKYILTGQLPASMSPTDKKAILEADQMVMASEQGLSMLNQAKALNPKAAGGLGMGTLAEIFAQIGDETALNTRDLENVLQSNVLPQLKAIFGGAPTEGERQILLDLQGSARKTVEERKRIIDRSIAAANARIGFYRDQAADIRGGSYYSPTRGQQLAAPTPPATGSTQPPSNGGFTVRKVR